MNLTQKIIAEHLVNGDLEPGAEIALKIDQTLTQDATGTLVMLELEALDLDKVQTELSVQYVDHNLLQADHKNPEDHNFLLSASKRYGLWFSRPGNGVSHPVHMQKFGIPGKTMAGSDSHTPAAGSLGMLAFGSGGLDVAMAMVGEPLYINMPKVLGVNVTGELPEWCSAKDAVLTMLEHYDVKGCVGYVIEYYGEGLNKLSAMDRHVIANMGTEMGASSSIFPSDSEVKSFLTKQGRADDFVELNADENADYDEYFHLDLSKVEPMIAKPSSPGNVVRVSEVVGKKIGQCVVGSSANPGLRDFWVIGEMLKNKEVHNEVSLDINPSSRQIIEHLSQQKAFYEFIHAGARFHQTGCLGCIGMGQAPATDEISLRTFPRNFPGRSGTKEDKVYLCSPETAAASAVEGVITDPRDFGKKYEMNMPEFQEPDEYIQNDMLFVRPLEEDDDRRSQKLDKGENIKSLPPLNPPLVSKEIPILLKLGDNISTDEILPGGANVLPFRSNIPAISEFSYSQIDENFSIEAKEKYDEYGGHIIIAGENYAQGSSREHAALAVKYLGQVAVIAKSYARIGWQNLVNFGIMPLEFKDAEDYEKFDKDDTVKILNLEKALTQDMEVNVHNVTKDFKLSVNHSLSDRQIELILKGGILNYKKQELQES